MTSASGQLVRPPVFDLGLSQSDSQVKGSITAKAKGKERQPAVPYPSEDIGDDSLWVDRYEPMNEVRPSHICDEYATNSNHAGRSCGT